MSVMAAREWRVFLYLDAEDVVQDVHVTNGITAL